MTDPVEELAGRLRALDDEPVQVHPAALDEVHRGLVAELDRLAGAVAGDARTASGSPHTQS